jgi:hypothetical protein
VAVAGAGAVALEVRVAVGLRCVVPDPVDVAALVCEAAGLVAVGLDRVAGDAWLAAG